MASSDLVALTLLPPSSWRPLAERLRAGWSPAALLEAAAAGRPDTTAADLRARAARALADGELIGAAAIAWNDPDYPPLLSAIADPPAVLWATGCLPALRAPAVAIVGSRAGSPYALAVAERLAADLAARGVAVVSGLARGVDAAAHKGALSAAGATIGVLGCGVDIVYPAEHRSLARELQRAGVLLSELVPGTPPLAHFFPL